MTTWRILRAQFWMLDRRLRQSSSGGRAVSIGLVGCLFVGGGWAYGKLVDALSTEQGLMMSAPLMLMGLVLLLFFTVVGLGDTLRRLYLASDLELLLAAPLSHWAIFAAKLLECSQMVWLQSAILAFALLALGDAQDAPALYFPLAAIMLLAAIAWVTALGMGLAILLARIIPPRWMQQWIPAAIALASVVFLIGQQALMRRFSNWAEAMVFLTTALLDMSRLAAVAASLTALAAASVLAVGWLFGRAFYGGWNSFQQVPTRRTAAPRAARRQGRLERLARLLPAPQRFLVIKESRTLAREPLRLVSLILMPLMMGVMLFPCLGAGNPYHVLVFWFLLFYGGMFATFSTRALALPAVGWEGRNIALLRSAPLSMRAVLSAKFWAVWPPMVLVWGLTSAVLGGLTRLPLWQIAWLVGALAWGLAGACAAAVALGTLGADFAADDPRRGVTVPMGYLGTITGGLSLLLALLSTAWLVIHLYSESTLVAPVRQAVGGYAVIGWWFSDSLWLPLALAGAQVAFWVGTRALWKAAARHLESFEGT